jgi:hypothetical protein
LKLLEGQSGVAASQHIEYDGAEQRLTVREPPVQRVNRQDESR